MRETWEQWRAAVLVDLVRSNVDPTEARTLVDEQDGWLKYAFAEGESAGSIALDLLALL